VIRERKSDPVLTREVVLYVHRSDLASRAEEEDSCISSERRLRKEKFL
jgi:hypothetical protein